MKQGKLILLPTIIGNANANQQIPEATINLIRELKYFIAENIKTSRRWIRSLNPVNPIQEIVFFEMGKHTSSHEYGSYLQPVSSGQNIGLMSEAGMPCIADPGSAIVALAHEKQIEVVPLSGPSSILLALAASGMNGQHFEFHGYLPVQKKEREQMIKKLENMAARNGSTQVFIETPYRSQQMMHSLVDVCRDATKICVAASLYSEDQFIRTLNRHQWLHHQPELNRKPCVFCLAV